MAKKEIKKSNLKFRGNMGENNSMKELLGMPAVISRARKEMFESTQRQNNICVEDIEFRPDTIENIGMIEYKLNKDELKPDTLRYQNLKLRQSNIVDFDNSSLYSKFIYGEVNNEN